MPVDYFGEDVAERYDRDLGRWGDPEVVGSTVDFLAELAGAGSALELGIGTGRIAIPLAQRGVRVHGIDLSQAMVERLRAKPGGERIETTIGDFATTKVDGAFSLAYVVFNTIMNLTTQDEQVACFENVGAHLDPGGCFVVEVAVPRAGQKFDMFSFASPTKFGFDEYDPVDQRLVSHHYAERDGTFGPWSIPFRYVWPAELDLMARIAGMRLRERWADWRREPFTSESTKHISVWEKQSGP